MGRYYESVIKRGYSITIRSNQDPKDLKPWTSVRLTLHSR